MRDPLPASRGIQMQLHAARLFPKYANGFDKVDPDANPWRNSLFVFVAWGEFGNLGCKTVKGDTYSRLLARTT